MSNRKKYKLPANYMDIIYTPSDKITYEENDEGLVVLKIENTGFYNTVAQKFFKRPRFSYISLDKYGTVVWKNLNGNTTVNEVVENMIKAFPDEKDRMLDRTIQFFRILDANKYIKKEEQ